MIAFLGRSLRQDRLKVLLSLAAIGVVTLMCLLADDAGVTVPIGYVVLPALAVSVVAGAAATALVAAVAILVSLGWYLVNPDDSWPARLLSIVIAGALATSAATVRSRRERQLQAQAAEVALARDHERTRLMSQAMLEQVPTLSATDDPDDVVRRAVLLARDVFDADAVSYWRVDGNDVVLVARTTEGELRVGDRYPRVLMAARDAAIADARTAWISRRMVTRASERLRLMERVSAGAGTSTPVRLDGAVAGYLCCSWRTEQPQASDGMLQQLDRFADQLALAKTVVRKRLAQQEAQRLGARLQAALLPQVATDAAGVSVRTLYRPGTRDLLLGGDFLDVTPRADGGLAFLIGDVSGHGPEQAAVAASLRAAWSAMAALPVLGLDDWISGLDAVLSEQRSGPDLFVTLLLGLLDPAAPRVSYVAAGHPPPIRLCHGSATLTPGGGPPLGVLHDVSPPRVDLDLVPGEALLLVTDGIFEGHDGPGTSERVGLDGFVAACRGLDARDPAMLAQLADAMTARNGGAFDDDVAALLLVLPERPARLDLADGRRHAHAGARNTG